jgi:hypothetical protein
MLKNLGTGALLISASLSLAAPLANAANDGNALFKQCTSAPQTVDSASCILYITGFVHGVNAASSGALCLPKDFTGAEGVSIFVRIMRNVRMAEHFGPLSMDLVLAVTLGMEFPCKR